VVLVHDRSTLRQREVQSTDRPIVLQTHSHPPTPTGRPGARSIWTPTLPARRSRRSCSRMRIVPPLMFGSCEDAVKCCSGCFTAVGPEGASGNVFSYGGDFSAKYASTRSTVCPRTATPRCPRSVHG
jgi:hypothetical protein